MMSSRALGRQLLRWVNERRRVLIVLAHTFLVSIAFTGAFFLRFDFAPPPDQLAWLAQTLPILLAVRLAVFWRYHLFEGLWRYVGVSDLIGILKAVSISTVGFIAIVIAFFGHGFPRSVYAIDWLLCCSVVAGSRVVIRLFREWYQGVDRSGSKRCLIVGAGDAGEMLLREFQRTAQTDYEVAGFIDDNLGKRGIRVHGLPVLGRVADLPAVAADVLPDEIIIAMPSAPREVRARVLGFCRECRVPVKSVPALNELLTARAGIGQLQQVAPEHLLSRESDLIDLEFERQRLLKLTKGKSVLVTGAAGSIGSELCRQVAQLEPGILLMLERSESGLYYLELELKQSFPGLPCIPVVGDILDAELVDAVMHDYSPSLVLHAAAYKHVPLMEAHPVAAVENNIFGTEVVAQAAERHGVETFVLISTDKAVRPVSVMGMTKRVAEGVLASRRPSATRFVSVRFGNVLGSDGSVLPLFKWQIASGGPVTVTDAEASRYFMLTSEAVRLVLQAGAIGEAGNIYYLDMGEPVNVMELAENLIRLSGMEPNRDVTVETVGLRPGEKLHEELAVASDELIRLEDERMFLVREPEPDPVRFAAELDVLRALADARDETGCIEQLRRMT